MRTTFVLGALSFFAIPRAAHAEPRAEDAPARASAHAPVRVERNSIPMMITGIGLMAVGVVAVGVGTGLMIQGHQNCDRDAASKTVGLSTADASALYVVAEDVCVGESAMINGGLASIIGGSVFAAAGVAFTLGGAWKVTVPERAAKAPSLRIGLGSIALLGSF